MLRQAFEASTRLAHQLNEDVLLAEDVLLYVVDWLDGSEHFCCAPGVV